MQKISKQKGVSVLLVIMITGVILIVSLAVSDLVLRQAKFSASLGESAQAYYAAESGIEEGLYKLRRGLEFTQDQPVYLNDDTYYELEYESQGVVQVLKAEGNYRDTRRKIEARY